MASGNVMKISVPVDINISEELMNCGVWKTVNSENALCKMKQSDHIIEIRRRKKNGRKHGHGHGHGRHGNRKHRSKRGSESRKLSKLSEHKDERNEVNENDQGITIRIDRPDGERKEDDSYLLADDETKF